MTRAELWHNVIEGMMSSCKQDMFTPGHSETDEATVPVQLEVLGAATKVIASLTSDVMDQAITELMGQAGGRVDEILAKFMADFPIADSKANE